ncbi:MAG: EamA family transporter [Gammaproteobacteria bacterium]|nr:EamA family transporter [Gammaproteobacteria bacterium]
MQAHTQHTSVFAVISLLVSATLWGVFWYPLRWLEHFGLHGVWITFLVYCGTLIYCVPIIGRHYRDFARQPIRLLLIALSSGWCNTAFILAVLEGEVVRVILLFYLSPIWATLLARLVLKERLTRVAYLTLFIAFAGAMLMLWSPEVGYPWPQSRADWMGLSSGLAFALLNLFIHMTDDVKIQTKTVSSWLGVILVAGGSLLVLGDPLTVHEPIATLYALLVGMTLTGAMTWLVVYGVTHMPVHRSATILLFEVVAAAVSTYLLTEERMSTREWIGGLAVILAAYFSARQHTALPAVTGDAHERI